MSTTHYYQRGKAVGASGWVDRGQFSALRCIRQPYINNNILFVNLPQGPLRALDGRSLALKQVYAVAGWLRRPKEKGGNHDR